MTTPVNGCAIKRCTRCSAAIFWTRTAKSGSWMPINAEPVTDGNVVVEGYGHDARAHVMAGGLFDDTWAKAPHYVSHFKTCPAANEMRKARTRRQKPGAG